MFNKEPLMMSNGGSGSSDWYKGLPYIQIEANPASHNLSGLDQDGASVFTFEIDENNRIVYIDVDEGSPQADYIAENAPYDEYWGMFGGDYVILTLGLLTLFPNERILRDYITNAKLDTRFFITGMVEGIRASFLDNYINLNDFLEYFQGFFGDGSLYSFVETLLMSYANYGGEYLVEDDYVFIEVTPYDIIPLLKELDFT